jgi:hypothetical protein
MSNVVFGEHMGCGFGNKVVRRLVSTAEAGVVAWMA